MNLEDFIKLFTNIPSDFDGYYGVQCMDLILTPVDKYYKIDVCHRELKDFKKEIRIGEIGRVVQTNTEKTIHIMEELIPKKLKKSCVYYTLMKAVQHGKVMMLVIQQYIDGLRTEYQNQSYVLNVVLKKLWTYLTQITRTRETCWIGNGCVGVATPLKIKRGIII